MLSSTKELESSDDSEVAPVVGEVDEVDDEPLVVVLASPVVSPSAVPGPCPSLVASVPPVG
ncbi:hypothetical protein OV079_33800 [Nannocystis pusilla]|uniref:Uncharacterized protein n=1 Tax=Nannocystis pusilla TaxID=889268 RepID=A0A9X3EUC9_9BACT|nr:hypothetical protein [Nannocystis pusilla]MCY1010457.1 hypothetical protein [Nannocystis pusilla]